MPTILIVDDHPLNRKLLVALLHTRGYQLLEAGDGVEALEVVRAVHPDLVISDLVMPIMDGVTFVRELRADAAIAQTPVIFSTAALEDSAIVAQARSSGVACILTKPASMQTILDVVAATLMRGAPVLLAESPDSAESSHSKEANTSHESAIAHDPQ